MIQEKYVHKAAQLWCLSKHEQKEMDTEFAHSIAKEFESFYNQGRKDAIDEVMGFLRKRPMELDWPLWEMTPEDVANSLEKKLQEKIT